MPVNRTRSWRCGLAAAGERQRASTWPGSGEPREVYAPLACENVGRRRIPPVLQQGVCAFGLQASLAEGAFGLLYSVSNAPLARSPAGEMRLWPGRDWTIRGYISSKTQKDTER